VIAFRFSHADSLVIAADHFNDQPQRPSDQRRQEARKDNYIE
jgi:hypothetical protein